MKARRWATHTCTNTNTLAIGNSFKQGSGTTYRQCVSARPAMIQTHTFTHGDGGRGKEEEQLKRRKLSSVVTHAAAS